MYVADVHWVKRIQMNHRGPMELPRRQSIGGLFILR
jgi:hypothetical protein